MLELRAAVLVAALLWIAALRKKRLRRSLSLALAILFVLTLAPLSPARASFPGSNGPLLMPGFTSSLLSLNGDEQELDWNASGGRFSADGASVAYRSPTPNDFYGDKVRVRTSAGDDFLVASFNGFVEEVTWSPNGQELAVLVIREDGSSPIYRVSIQASDPVVLVNSGEFTIRDIEWNPTNAIVAYNDGLNFFTVPAVGGAPTNHTDQCTYFDGYADCSAHETTYYYDQFSWSPDGTKLVVDTDAVPSDAPGSTPYVGTLALGSGSRIPDAVLAITKGEQGGWSPADPIWSPDGAKIAIDWEPPGDPSAFGTYVIPATGGTPDHVGDFGAHDWQPCPTGECPSFGTDDRVPTTLTLTVSKDSDSIDAIGALRPGHPGSSVTVTLSRLRNGTWRVIRSRKTTLAKNSVYAASFGRPASGTCRIIVKFAGDADHRPSSARKKFPC